MYLQITSLLIPTVKTKWLFPKCPFDPDKFYQETILFIFYNFAHRIFQQDKIISSDTPHLSALVEAKEGVSSCS